MTEDAIIRHLTGARKEVQVETSDGSSFFFVGDDHHFPFATLVTQDGYDSFSNLGRPGIFRLNIGVSKETFRSLFDSGEVGAVQDFTVLDQLMPHPVYGPMFWVCVLNPGEETFRDTVCPLLTEALEMAVTKNSRRGS